MTMWMSLCVCMHFYTSVYMYKFMCVCVCVTVYACTLLSYLPSIPWRQPLLASWRLEFTEKEFIHKQMAVIIRSGFRPQALFFYWPTSLSGLSLLTSWSWGCFLNHISERSLCLGNNDCRPGHAVSGHSFKRYAAERSNMIKVNY